MDLKRVKARGAAAAQPRPRRRAAAIRSCRPAAAASRSQAARAASPERSTWGPRRGRRAAALGSWRRGWAQRPAGRSAHDRGWVGQGRAPGLGLLQRAADATAGPRHTRPRGSPGAHAGVGGGKMRAIRRRIQRAHVRRNRRAGGRATSAAVRLRCDAMAGSRHTRPRGSQGAHAGLRGGKMRAILRRIQRAYFRRHRRTGSRATQVAVRREHA